MNKVIKVAGGGLLAMAAALPAASRDADPQIGSYLVWNFGASRNPAANSFHYGLRLDQDSHVAIYNLAPPTLLLNFNRDGLQAYLNGSSLNQMALRLQQAEAAGALSTSLTAVGVVAGVAATAVVATEVASDSDGSDEPEVSNPGNGSGSGSGGSSGSGSSSGGSSGSGSSSGGSTSGGTGSGSSSGSGSGSTSGGSTGGGSTSGGSTSGSSSGGSTSGGSTGGLLGGSGYRGTRQVFEPSAGPDIRGIDPEYQKWLDGGSGQMGDLGL